MAIIHVNIAALAMTRQEVSRIPWPDEPLPWAGGFLPSSAGKFAASACDREPAAHYGVLMPPIPGGA